MKYRYRPSGVCSSEITFDIEGGKVTNINFVGGCNGNLKAISKLLEGQKVEYIIEKLEGNTCGRRNTSCADQLVQALKNVKNN